MQFAIISSYLYSEARSKEKLSTVLSVSNYDNSHPLLSLCIKACKELKNLSNAANLPECMTILHQKLDMISFHRLTPQLTGVREETRNSNYSLVLEFKVKKDMTEKMWTDRQSKIQTFFGPGVSADIEFPSEQEVHVYLTTDGRWAASRHLAGTS